MYLKLLARKLGLPTEALQGDLKVMMYGLTDLDYDVENLQVVIPPFPGGKTLSLKSVDSIVLVVSIPLEILVTEPEEIDSECDFPSLNFEMRQLIAVLLFLEE